MYIFALILFFISDFASAGWPNQDPEVARIQQEFAAGKTPSMDDLRLGKEWKCNSFNAIKDHLERYEGPSYKFEQRSTPQGEPYILEMFAYAMVQNHQVDAANISFVYKFANDLFMGQPYEDPSITEVHTYVRLSKSGKLIVEIAAYNYPYLPKEVIAKRESVSVPSGVFPELRLMGFDECKLAP